MRRAITIARKHGEKNFVVLIGPEVHLNTHSAAFKGSIIDPAHDFAEIEVWTSSAGVSKRKQFSPRIELPAPVSEQRVLDAKALQAATLPELQQIARDLWPELEEPPNDRATLISDILCEVALRDEAEEERACKDLGTF